RSHLVVPEPDARNLDRVHVGGLHVLLHLIEDQECVFGLPGLEMGIDAREEAEEMVHAHVGSAPAKRGLINDSERLLRIVFAEAHEVSAPVLEGGRQEQVASGEATFEPSVDAALELSGAAEIVKIVR